MFLFLHCYVNIFTLQFCWRKDFSSWLEVREEGVGIWREINRSVGNRTEKRQVWQCPMHSASAVISTALLQLSLQVSISSWERLLLSLCQISNWFMHHLWGDRLHLLVSLNNLLGSWSASTSCPWFIELLQLESEVVATVNPLLNKRKKKKKRKGKRLSLLVTHLKLKVL